MLLPNFHSARILVAGDLMLDRYWHGATSRISPEAPVPVVLVKQSEERAGGAGNVALNIASLGSHVSVMGYCGEDEAAESLTAILEHAGIRCLIQKLQNLPTITKLRVISRHQQLIRLDFEENLYGVEPKALLKQFESQLAHADVVVLSDYGKGVLNPVQEMIALCKTAGKPVLVDPKGSDFDKYRHADLLTPNLAEFEAIVGYCTDEADIECKGMALLQKLDLEALLITRSEHGMTLIRKNEAPLHLSARAQEVFDVTGAGDTVIAVLAAALASGTPIEEATAFANLAAGIVVGKLGTACVSPSELDDALHGPRAHQRGVIELPALIESVMAARAGGERIVLTNGCFDILHPGHVHYLQQAKALGDRLIVLVNSDDSVKRLKGPSRPVNSLEHRMMMLAALECVDWVLSFDEDTPQEKITEILPDILVKGGDYQSIDQIAGSECVLANGGEVKLLSFVEGYSTTHIIETIQNNA